MSEVLQPLNERAAQIVTEHIDLLESSRVEPQLLQLVAHVCSVRVVLERCVRPAAASLPRLQPPCGRPLRACCPRRAPA
jgi:hypothetical protein